MPYTNIDTFEKKELKVFQKSLEGIEFYEKMGQKK
jgi:hypothetical protein